MDPTDEFCFRLFRLADASRLLNRHAPIHEACCRLRPKTPGLLYIDLRLPAQQGLPSIPAFTLAQQRRCSGAPLQQEGERRCNGTVKARAQDSTISHSVIFAATLQRGSTEVVARLLRGSSGVTARGKGPKQLQRVITGWVHNGDHCITAIVTLP